MAKTITALAIGVGATASVAQVSIGSNGIRSGNTVIDGSGVHTNGTDVTSGGVRTGRGSGTVIRTNGSHRSINCAGGPLTVNGNANHFTVSGCSAVTLNGNEIDPSFARNGRIEVMGNRNTVRWSAASAFESESATWARAISSRIGSGQLSLHPTKCLSSGMVDREMPWYAIA